MNIVTTSMRCALAAALLATPNALTAQRATPSLDVGASSVRYADSISISATVFSPGLRIESSNATITASGTFSQIASGGWTTQGALGASAFVPLGGRAHGELMANAGASAHQDGTRTGQLLAQGRAHVMGRARGLWLGGGVGTTWDGFAAHGLTLLDAGAWASTGNTTIVVAVAPMSILDAGQPSFNYTDATAAARWVGSRAEVGASFGARVGSNVPELPGASSWGTISGAFWLAGPLALAASVGSYPVDYTQGYPGGRYASISMRLARRPASKSTSSSDVGGLAAAGSVAAIGPIASFSVGPSANRRHRTIAVRARAASSVEVTGDFTGWQPVRLARQRDGRWVTTLAIPAGTHEIALRVDGGAWLAPPGLTAIRDEFGGTSGLLTIRE